MTTALLSVSNKTGIVDLARELDALGFTIISTGGTARTISEAGINVTKVSDITEFPEIMDGRVKTLHPKIHGGLLGVLDNEDHVQQMEQHGISSIDLVVVNLYPFEETLQRQGVTHEEIIENIDIGGPAMVRASAKNYRHTCVVVDPKRYNEIIGHLKSSGDIPLNVREQLAYEAFSHTAHYDARISGYLSGRTGQLWPPETAAPLRLEQPLRYGENPHQEAALFGTFTKIFRQLHGKELSYNNILDIDAAAKLSLEFDEPTVCIIKHNNPCGVGSADTLLEAWDKAFATDTVSPFGGIVCVNREIDLDFAEKIHSIFTEVIIAPSFAADALERLMKKKDRRLMQVDRESLRAEIGMELRTVAGGFLAQMSDASLMDDANVKVVTKRQPTDAEQRALLFAWKVAKHVKSNAIVYAREDRTLGIGAGQMSRVDSARIAVSKAADAGLDLQGCAVASDAFFPFADGLIQAAEAGATCVVQPGGSIRDEEVIAAADERGLSMMFTAMRHFRH
jgi:phosphoribosylaminoimidazolecarboxamide formyltransferase / IMP cyclohydrolase